jgi:hypothetical protein
MPARLTGRMSRAAVFASATTLAGCWSQAAPQQTTPPDRVETNFAKPPDEASRDETSAETGSIHVTVLDSGTGQPQPQRSVTLTGPGIAEQQAIADANGVARFGRLPPGTYTVTIPSNHPRRTAPSEQVIVTAGQTTRANLSIFVMQPHHSPMPYGAPPARRRIV